MRKENTRKNKQGFTSTELLIVMAIFGILSAIAIPSFLRSQPERRLKNATRNLFADLQRARLLAVNQNRSITVTFDAADGTYTYGEGDNTVVRTLADYGAVSYDCSATSTNWSDPPASIPDSGMTRDNLTFKSTGTATSGSVYLQSRNDTTVCFAVSVSDFGNIKIRKFTSENGWDGE